MKSFQVAILIFRLSSHLWFSLDHRKATRYLVIPCFFLQTHTFPFHSGILCIYSCFRFPSLEFSGLSSFFQLSPFSCVKKNLHINYFLIVRALIFSFDFLFKTVFIKIEHVLSHIHNTWIKYKEKQYTHLLMIYFRGKKVPKSLRPLRVHSTEVSTH